MPRKENYTAYINFRNIIIAAQHVNISFKLGPIFLACGVVRCPSGYSSVIAYQQNQYLLATISINFYIRTSGNLTRLG